ncbi:MAG: RNA-binding S4 domain-containing protein [Parvularculaceae bacterium]
MTRGEKLATPRDPATSQRIDKWLWCARLYKTRTLAAKIVASGAVRLSRNGSTSRVEKASALVRAGDRLAFLNGPRLRILEITACADRRGTAADARILYTDHSPTEAPPQRPAERETGAGRPTKKDRRAIDRFNKAS